MTVRVQDNGAHRIIVTLADAKAGRPWTIDVGVIGPNASKAEGPGVTVGDVATWAELGLGQPMRSWLRAYFEENESKIMDRVSKEMQAVIKGRSQKKALKRIGVFFVGQIQERISDKIPPPNAPSTIAAKGSSTPLINTGQFRTSITSRIRNV